MLQVPVSDSAEIAAEPSALDVASRTAPIVGLRTVTFIVDSSAGLVDNNNDDGRGIG
jgi:hypothetical protein